MSQDKGTFIDFTYAGKYTFIYKYTSYTSKGGCAMTDLITVSSKGQITIPLFFREKYGIQAGDKLFPEPREDGFFIKKPKDIFALEGFLSGVHIPDDEEELLTPETGRKIMERE
jgi:AbrB family looped-hinge helix DNA binding protein